MKIICSIKKEESVILYDCKGNKVINNNDILLQAKGVKKKIVYIVAPAYADIKSSEYKKTDSIIWMLECSKSGKKNVIVQVGSSTSIYNMINNDIVPDAIDILTKHEKYGELLDEFDEFTFCRVDIDEEIGKFRKAYPHLWEALDEEIHIALCKKEMINPETRLNCAEALLAKLYNCRSNGKDKYPLWNPASRNGEKYYYQYFADLFKEEDKHLADYNEKKKIREKLPDFLEGKKSEV